MPRPSTGSSSGDVEMRDVEPTLGSVYPDRPSEFDGDNDACMPSEAPSAGPSAAAAQQPDEALTAAEEAIGDGAWDGAVRDTAGPPNAATLADNADVDRHRDLTLGGENG